MGRSPAHNASFASRPKGITRSRRRPLAMTLVETLVAVAGVSTLISILLPVIGNLREQSRMVSCANRIARVARGFASHDTSRSQLPGWRNTLGSYTSTLSSMKKGKADSDGDGIPDSKAEACVSWTVTTLPYIGESELYDWYDTYTATRVADDATRKRVPLFVCPTAAPTSTSPSPLHYFTNGGNGALSTDGQGRQYTGDGVCLDAAGNQRGQPWYISSGGAKEYLPGRASLAGVAEGDGTSNTLLLAERTGEVAPTDVSWADNPQPPANNADKAVKTCHAVMHTRGIHPGYGQPGGGESLHATMNTWMKTRGDNGLRYPSSRHEGGFMTAFCDGHVKFISHAVDEWVYTQLLTSNRHDLSFRVSMFEKIAQPDGSLLPAIYSEADLTGDR